MAKLKKETVESIKRNPINTKDKGKVKAYADSLDAYNKGEKIYNEFLQFANKNNLAFNKANDIFIDDGNNYVNEYYPIDKINKKLSPKEKYSFVWRRSDDNFDKAIDKNNNYVNEGIGNKLHSFLENYSFLPLYHAPRYKKPVQPYLLKEDEIVNPIKSIGQKEINIEEEGVNPVQLKNKKVSAEEPEHFLDISEPDGKGTKRMYFETREELENFQKENPMLKTGSFSRAKIKPEVLEILKKKK